MIRILMLTILVIYLSYVGATIGASCQGDSNCDTRSEACSSLGRCQCKAGYRIHIYPTGSLHFGPGPNISECQVCNTTVGFGTCMCNGGYYEYQGSCYLKGNHHNHTCYTAEGCHDILNFVCSNSSGGICLCRTGYFLNHHGRCAEKGPLGGSCLMPDACKDDHARCTGYLTGCLCMDGYYAHQGTCILKGSHNETCYTAEGCRDTMNLMCSNSSGGICVCQTGYYLNHYSRCTEKLPVGHGCYMPDACRDEHARCTSLISSTPVCLCMDGYYVHQESCILMIDAPKNLLVLNVTSRAFKIWLEKPNEVFGELLGYVLTIKLADTGRCVIEYIIRCESGCVNPFPNETALLITCPLIIQYQSVSKEDLVMIERNINTLGPGTVYWVSAAAVSQYGKGYPADINVTTLHEGDLNVSSHLESNSMTTIIIVSIACGTLIVIALMAAGTFIIVKRKRASKRKSEADASSAYMDLPCKTNEDHYDTLAVTSAY